jgi:hypothetical protein
MKTPFWVALTLLFSATKTLAQVGPSLENPLPIDTPHTLIRLTLVEPDHADAIGMLPDAPLPKASKDQESSCSAGLGRPCAFFLGGRPDPLQAPFQRENARLRVADKKFWLVTAGSDGASLLATWAGIHCRHHNGVEPCTAHYGEFAATEGVRFGFSVIVVQAIAYRWKKDDEGTKHSSWWLFPASNIAFNVGYAIREFNQGCKGPRRPNGGRCE